MSRVCWVALAAVALTGCNERKVVYVNQVADAAADTSQATPGFTLTPPPPGPTPTPSPSPATAPVTSGVAFVSTDLVGTGAPGFAGDGGSAQAAQLDTPRDVAFDAAGNIYLADTGNAVVRRVDAVTGAITTVAGTGVPGFAGDGGPAVEAQLRGPTGVSLDAAGNLYIADALDHRIRMVDTAGLITTLAGDGLPGFGGDQGPAEAAQLDTPYRVEVTPLADRIFIVDQGNHRIRKIQEGIMITVVGAGAPGGNGGFGGDGGLGIEALLDRPSGLAFDDQLNLYIADSGNHRIRRLDWSTFELTTVVGTGTPGYAGDAGGAALAQLTTPSDVVYDGDNDRLLIADAGNLRVRSVVDIGLDATSHIIDTVAGDGFPALAQTVPELSRLSSPDGLALWQGSVVVADRDDHRVRSTMPR